MKKLIFDISEEMNSNLKELQEKRGLNRANLCRFAISKFIEQELKQWERIN